MHDMHNSTLRQMPGRKQMHALLDLCRGTQNVFLFLTLSLSPIILCLSLYFPVFYVRVFLSVCVYVYLSRACVRVYEHSTLRSRDQP